MKFNHLKVPNQWQHYWTKYPEGYTILEALIEWVSQVNKMVDNQNKLNKNVADFREELNQFIDRFDPRLQEEVIKTLSEWQESGFLDIVIDEALNTKYHEMDDRLTSQITQITYNVKSFGAKGDGVTDDTQAIKDALSFMKGKKGRLLFPPGVYIHGDGVKNATPTGYTQNGTYNVDGTLHPYYEPNDGVGYPYYDTGEKKVPVGNYNIGEDLRLVVDGLEDVEIIGYGAIIKAHDKLSCIRRNSGFVFTNCKNVTVKGLTYNGNIEERKPFLVDSGNYNLQHGFNIANNCVNVTLEDCNAIDCVMDGFYVHGTNVINCKLINCIARRNYRQGLSVGSSVNLIVDGGEYAETGTIYGTEPMWGIDLETATGNIKSPTIRNVLFYGNKGRIGCGFHFGTNNGLIENCIFEHQDFYEHNGNVVNNTVRNNMFINGGVIAHGGGTYIDDNKFYFDKNVQITHCPSVISDDSSNLFNQGKSRRGRIKGNYVECSTIDIPTSVNYFGGMIIGNDINIVDGNILLNTFSTLATGVINGRAHILTNNIVKYTGSRENVGSISTGKYVKDNEVDTIYVRSETANQNTSNGKLSNRYYIQKTFNLDYFNRIPTNKAVDITVKNVDSTLTLVKVTVVASGNIYGVYQKAMFGSSSQDIIELRDTSNFVTISSPTIRNNELTFTVKSNTPEETTQPDPENFFSLYGSIFVEVYTTTSQPLDVVMSNPYTV